MRVLHVVHQYMPEYVGGTELYTQWLAHALSYQGHDVSIFYRYSAAEAALRERVDKVQVGAMPESSVRVWGATTGPITATNRFTATFAEEKILQFFKQVLAETQPDLLHIQHLMGLPASLVRYVYDLGIPFVITLHDYWWICANAQLISNYNQEVCSGPKAYFNCARCALARINRPYLLPFTPPLALSLALRSKFLYQLMNMAHCVIAPDKFVADWYVAQGGSLASLQIIPHGLPLPNNLPKATAQPNKPFRFAYIGGLSWQKGVHVLLKAFSKLNGAATLCVVGDETADPDYVTLLRQLASKQVLFLGKLNREAIWQTLATVDVIVVPTLWYETFSFIISEAFAAGVPVIVSNLGALSNRVRHQVDGLLVPPNNVLAMQQALQRFLHEPTLLTQLQAGINPVETIESYADKIEQVYKTILTKAKSN